MIANVRIEREDHFKKKEKKVVFVIARDNKDVEGKEHGSSTKNESRQDLEEVARNLRRMKRKLLLQFVNSKFPHPSSTSSDTQVLNDRFREALSFKSFSSSGDDRPEFARTAQKPNEPPYVGGDSLDQY